MKTKILLFLLFTCIIQLSAEPIGEENPVPEEDRGIYNFRDKLIFDEEILKQKPVLLSFFFVGCAPCEKEMAALQKLNEVYKDKIEILLVSNSKIKLDTVKRYLEAKRITLQVLDDKDSSMALAFGVKKYPTLFIIGQDGKIKFSCSGYNNETDDKLEQAIATLQ